MQSEEEQANSSHPQIAISETKPEQAATKTEQIEDPERS
eukprot:COSAG05_NODE_21014_length_275_cov_0.585227_2_plen_38_part_01